MGIRIFRLDQALKRYDGKHEDDRTIREGDPGVRLEKTNRGYSNQAIDFRNSMNSPKAGSAAWTITTRPASAMR